MVNKWNLEQIKCVARQNSCKNAFSTLIAWNKSNFDRELLEWMQFLGKYEFVQCCFGQECTLIKKKRRGRIRIERNGRANNVLMWIPIKINGDTLVCFESRRKPFAIGTFTVFIGKPTRNFEELSIFLRHFIKVIASVQSHLYLAIIKFYSQSLF